MKNHTRRTQKNPAGATPTMEHVELIMRLSVAAGVLEIVGHNEDGNVYRLTPAYQRLSRSDAMATMAEAVWQVATPEERELL